MESGKCPECTRLWRAYGIATVHYADLADLQRRALQQGFTDRVQELEARIQEALGERDQAKANLDAHEAEFHSKRQ